MKILLVVEAASGGTGRHVADLAEGLAGEGHDVSIIYSPDRADVHLVRRLRRIPRCVLTPLDMRREVGLRDVLHVKRLRRFIREQGPFDIVHAHSSKAGALLRLAMLGDRSTPCIYTPHALVTLDSRMNPIKRSAYAAVEVLLSLGTQTIICVSDQEQTHARALGISESRLTTVPNGIDPVRFDGRCRLREELGFTADTVCIGTVGRLTHQKAVHRLISAFAMLHVEGMKPHLVVVGDGPLKSSLIEQVEQLGIPDRVTFVKADDNGARWMSAFDVFAMSSLYEAFPYVLLECASVGLPVVMTSTGGAGMIVRHGENGLIAPQDSLEALAGHLGTLVRSRTERERMGAASRALVSRFGKSSMVEGILAVYQRALSQ